MFSLLKSIKFDITPSEVFAILRLLSIFFLLGIWLGAESEVERGIKYEAQFLA